MDSERASSFTLGQVGLTAGQKIVSLFQPDTLLASQYFGDRRKKTLLEPEKRLMLAILEDAVYCFQDKHSARYGKKKRVLDEVEEWIFESRTDWIFGFESICSALGFNPEYIRRGLVRWRMKQLNHRPARLWNRNRLGAVDLGIDSRA